MSTTKEIAVEECSIELYERELKHIEKQLGASVSFLQSPFYARLQTKAGKAVVCFVLREGNTPIGCGVAVRYQAPGGLNFLYLPYGPVMTNWDDTTYILLEDFFRPIARKLKCAFVRLDNDELAGTDFASPISNNLARTASLQPRAEWVLDITPEKQDLWEAFHKHARYNVRLAWRAEAEIRVRSPQDTPLDDFYSLMQTTADRDGFGIFDREYYRAYLSTLTDKDGFTVLVRIDGKPAAVGLFVVHDRQAHYVFAGSSNEFRKIAPAYAVIWNAIQEAKSRGCTLFNFGGVTEDVKSQDLGGVTSFKKRFGGYQDNHPNPVDLVYKPWRYHLFKLYKSLR